MFNCRQQRSAEAYNNYGKPVMNRTAQTTFMQQHENKKSDFVDIKELREQDLRKEISALAYNQQGRSLRRVC